VHLPPPKVRAVTFAPSPLPAPGPQVAVEERAWLEDDQHRCLYVGTPWEAEVVAVRHDVEELKEASRTIGHVLSVRTLCRSF
jgi:hypothetical protein